LNKNKIAIETIENISIKNASNCHILIIFVVNNSRFVISNSMQIDFINSRVKAIIRL
jgi:hypothetical protein